MDLISRKLVKSNLNVLASNKCLEKLDPNFVIMTLVRMVGVDAKLYKLLQFQSELETGTKYFHKTHLPFFPQFKDK